MKKGVTILIVDDNPFNREMLSDILLTCHCEVDQANNGNEAIAKIQKKQYQIILMDMLMPGLDGFETTRKLRSMGFTMPIIAHTSMSMKKDRWRCMEAGCNEFLPKPIDKKKLIEFIEKFSESEQTASKEDTSSSKSDQSSKRFAGLKALLIEEDIKIKDLYIKLLEHRGIKVSHVSNGGEALTILETKAKQFDLILSNMFTSVIDGFGVLNTTKSEYPHLMVIIYGPQIDTATLQLTIQLGADGVIQQSDFEFCFENIIQTALNQKNSKTNLANTVLQVRKSQAKLTQYGCPDTCGLIDMAFSTLHDAGGDMAQCRHFNLGGRCGIVMADVSGHDVLSSYISAVFLGILSSLWNSHQEPLSLLRTINKELLRMIDISYHVCTTVILWDMRRQKLNIATAGNPGPILAKKLPDNQYEITHLEGGGLCLGLLERDDLYKNQEIDFNPGSRLFLFSDGIEMEMFAEVLKEKKQLLQRPNLTNLSQDILDAVLYKCPQKDDMIIVSLQSPDNYPSAGVHYWFNSDFDKVDVACEWITKQLNLHERPRGCDIDMMLLAIREALLNAVEHGNTYRVDGYIDISLYFKPNEFVVEISDEGVGFNLNEKIAESSTGSGFEIGKRGLSIMTAFADKIEIHGGTVILKFYDKK